MGRACAFETSDKPTDTTKSGFSLHLYHGSKGGITGPIAPLSRDKCDFGRGFYMGTEMTQPLTLVCTHPDAWLYEVELDLSGLKHLDVSTGLDWALFVAYNRGRLEQIEGSALYERYRLMAKDADVISGLIANDRMFVVLDRFFAGTITDTALVSCLSALNLGKQYVAVTEKACEHVSILSKRRLGEPEKVELDLLSRQNRASGVALADEICRQHRRDGRFFDEILAQDADLDMTTGGTHGTR